jgi:predicted ABC-type ATPase
MRVEPGEDIINEDVVKRRYQRRLDRITRIAAIILAALSTYTLIFKIVFF